MKFLLILSLFLSFSARAADRLTAPSERCMCGTLKDEFEDPQEFSFGKFSGSCVDSCRFRASKLLKGSSYKSVKNKAGDLLIANIFHMGKFYVGSIPTQNFVKASVGFEEFHKGIYHVFLKFELDDKSQSIILVDQGNGSKETAQTRSLIISSEGVPPIGQKYSLVESLFNNYIFVHRITTGAECDRWTSSLKHPVNYYSLNLSKKQVSQILATAIHKSSDDQLQAVYHLFTNNCATAALDFINVGDNSKIQSQWFQADKGLPIAGPFSTLGFLSRLKLISSKTLKPL